MKDLKLEFRAKLPDGTWFNQDTQYLNSFLRRVQSFWSASHDKYVEGGIEEKLQIKIDGEWVQCKF